MTDPICQTNSNIHEKTHAIISLSGKTSIYVHQQEKTRIQHMAWVGANDWLHCRCSISIPAQKWDITAQNTLKKTKCLKLPN